MYFKRLALTFGVVLLAAGCAGVQTSDVTRVTGGTLGGVFGGLLGSQVGSGTGQLVSTALGSSLGALFGGAIGGSIGAGISNDLVGRDDYSEPYTAPPPAAPSLAYGRDEARMLEAQAAAAGLPIGSGVDWENPGTGNFGRVTAVRDGTSSAGYYCREFESEASFGGRAQLTYSVACQFPDGSWHAVE